MQQLLCLMLSDQNERPTAESLLRHPTMVFFDFIVHKVDQGFSIDNSVTDQISQKFEIMPALVSALSLSDKNKAIVAYFTLMRIMEQH